MPVHRDRLINTSKLSRTPFYQLRVQTGLITAIAAATSSAGHCIAVRNSGAIEFYVTRMALRWLSLVDPGTAQRVGFIANKLTGYSASHTGGTAATTESPSSRAEAAAP